MIDDSSRDRIVREVRVFECPNILDGDIRLGVGHNSFLCVGNDIICVCRARDVRRTRERERW